MLEVAGAALPCKATGAAVEVEVVVLAQVAVHGCAVQSARNVLADAQAILVDEAVLLAGYSSTKPVPTHTLGTHEMRTCILAAVMRLCPVTVCYATMLCCDILYCMEKVISYRKTGSCQRYDRNKKVK